MVDRSKLPPERTAARRKIVSRRRRKAVADREMERMRNDLIDGLLLPVSRPPFEWNRVMES